MSYRGSMFFLLYTIHFHSLSLLDVFFYPLMIGCKERKQLGIKNIYTKTMILATQLGFNIFWNIFYPLSANNYGDTPSGCSIITGDWIVKLF